MSTPDRITTRALAQPLATRIKVTTTTTSDYERPGRPPEATEHDGLGDVHHLTTDQGQGQNLRPDLRY